ncbi:MAG: hypothetical protein P4L46_22960 [Fimbriimonas sp.]|nr:hypothetical protein [Fimbriimonas sp.]
MKRNGTLLTTSLAFALMAGPCVAGPFRSPGQPPATWQEHWFEHKQLLKLVSYNNDVAVYFDDDVTQPGTEWILPFMTKLWRYTKRTYGDFGKDRLFCVFHQGKYSGGHPSTRFDDSHDFRNVTDCGPGPWTTPAIDIPSHEAGHIVEGSNNGIHGSPAFGIWGDSKWNEFFQFDVYTALGLKEDAQRLLDRYSKGTDNFPRPKTHWFRDWFYPLWKDHGHAQVMVRFFGLLAKNYPHAAENGGKDQAYSRDMNWGEYVHFMSGAAKTDLRPMAKQAFGWSDEWETQYEKAKSEFSKIKY